MDPLLLTWAAGLAVYAFWPRPSSRNGGSPPPEPTYGATIINPCEEWIDRAAEEEGWTQDEIDEARNTYADPDADVALGCWNDVQRMRADERRQRRMDRRGRRSPS